MFFFGIGTVSSLYFFFFVSHFIFIPTFFLMSLIALPSHPPVIAFCCWLPVRFLPLPHAFLVDLRVVSCGRSELCCHFSHYWGKKKLHLLILLRTFPLFVPRLQTVWFCLANSCQTSSLQILLFYIFPQPFLFETSFSFLKWLSVTLCLAKVFIQQTSI